VAIALAVLSAMLYGFSDFLGGLVSRRHSAWYTATFAQALGTVVIASAALVVSFAQLTVVEPTSTDFLLGAFGGIAASVGVVFLYRGLARGRMSVVAPVSALGAAIVPVAFGLLTGGRPSWLADLGIVLALIAIGLISRAPDNDPSHHGGLLDGLLAGAGFGAQFVVVGQMSAHSGFAPVALMYAASTAVLATFAVARGHLSLRNGNFDRRVLLIGPLGAAAVLAFAMATKVGLLAVVSVIAALYPASTVMLAAVVLRERVRPDQAVGLALAAVAVAFVVLG
jgi:drug/metabolite transporter (DMT)-like permease